ncbi:elongation factor P [candidate division KSB1 bacterium]
MIPANQMKVGMIINFRDNFCQVTSLLHQAIGRGGGKVVAKLKNLSTGANVEHKFRSSESVEPVRIETHELEFLYESGAEYYFMRTDNYEQIMFTEEMVKDIKLYLIPNEKYPIDFFEEKPISIQPPRTLVMEVKETEPGLKGATAAAQLKPATLETGLVVNIPAFIESGTKIKIDTTENKYIERA